jgi:hypothetical protein
MTFVFPFSFLLTFFFIIQVAVSVFFISILMSCNNDEIPVCMGGKGWMMSCATPGQLTLIPQAGREFCFGF